MKAIGYRQNEPFNTYELPDPTPGAQDLLVEVQAVSVNPVDLKVRANMPVPAGEVKVLGWDAVGVVKAVGAAVKGFAPGDRVWYAGSIARPGSNSPLHLVDARIASHAPKSLDLPQAAALPLTTITAWELLFDRLGIPRQGGQGKRLLVVGGAGGVGSILIQLARQLTQLEVITTASRPETTDWVRRMGAHEVIDHSKNIADELTRIGRAQVEYAICLTQTSQHYEALVSAIAPQGKFALIDDPDTNIDVRLLKRKSISLHWESMFTRSVFNTADLAEQGKLLAEVAALVDAGTLQSTFTRNFGPLTPDNLNTAHAWIASGRAIGKGVLVGF